MRKTREYPNSILENYQPEKTKRTDGKLISVPLHDDLVAAIAAMDVIGTDTYLITDYGKPFGNKGFGTRMRESRRSPMSTAR